MPNIVGIGITQVPTNAMLGGLAYQDPAHANLTEVEIENISRIKAKINKSAAGGKSTIFVYDTRKDSDGGAWRYRTQHTSWYNEPPGLYRGSRKEFPSIVVIVGTTTDVTIYDGDDPNLSMWMVFKAGGGGMGDKRVVQYDGASYRVCALNGQLVIGQGTGVDNYGNPAINFISEEIVRADPQHSSEGGIYAGGIALRNQDTGSGFVQTSTDVAGQNYTIANSRIRDIGMRVLANALIDPKSGLPMATIAYAHYSGISVVTADDAARPVYDITAGAGSSYNIANFVDITEDGKLIFEQDGSNGRSVFYMPIPSADDTSETNDGSITDKVVLKPYYNSLTYPRWNEPLGTNQGITEGCSMKDGAHALLSFGGSANGGKVTLVQPGEQNIDEKYGRVAYLSKDYNTGWMVGGTRSCLLATKYTEPDGVNYALTATAGSTARLTSETYDSGDVEWQMVDDAASNNGYVVIEMKGLTIGQDYKVSMTRSSHATLDAGYSHGVVHQNGGTYENKTKFTGGNWNVNNGSSHGVIGYFTAQSVNDDDLVLYVNGSTINITNFRIEETNDTGDGIATGDLLNDTGTFDSSSGWQNHGNGWNVSGGVATKNDTQNNSIYRTVGGFIPGRTYAVTCTVTTNNGNLWFYIPYSYTAFPISGTGAKTAYFVASSSTHPIGITGTSSNGSVIDNLKVRLVESDRVAGGSGGLFAYGQIQKTPVEEGADLAAYYMGADVQHYFYQSYNANLDFTSEMSLMVWVKDFTSGTSLLHRGPDTTRNSQTSFYLYCDATNDYRFTLTTDGSGEQNFEIQLPDNAVGILKGWQHICFTLKGGTVKGYLNGIEQTLSNSSFSGTNIFSQATNQNGLYIGRGCVGNHFTGKMALLRLSSSAPFAEDVARIYKDERAMFQPNAKCTIYGTSDDVKHIAYDSTTDNLHVGTSSGRSDFSGLCRINNTTTAVTTAISASNGLIAEQ